MERRDEAKERRNSTPRKKELLMGPRKIIQITSHYEPINRDRNTFDERDHQSCTFSGTNLLFALCDDGTVWTFSENHWTELPRTGLDPEGERVEGKSL